VVLKDFFHPKWQHSDHQVRLRVVTKVSDETVLAQIVKDDDVVDVIEAGIQFGVHFSC
jgi:hypothetical protein